MNRLIHRLASAIIVISISLTACAPSENNGAAGNPSENGTALPVSETTEYLLSTGAEIDAEHIGEVLENAGLDNYNIYFIGEVHGVAKNYDAELLFLKHLNKTQGVRHIMLETGFCSAQLISVYMQTGDTQYLERVFNNLAGTMSFSQESFNYFVNIYEYNQTLPEDERLVFTGVDVQHQFAVGVYYLTLLLPEEAVPPEEISGCIAALNAVGRFGGYTGFDFNSLEASISAFRELYEEFLGDSFYNFQTSIRNIRQGIDYLSSGAADAFPLRERYITWNFIEHYERLDIYKCFGSFGAMHTDLSGYAGESWTPSLAKWLNGRYERTSGKVASITLMYAGCNYIDNERTGNAAGRPVTQNTLDDPYVLDAFSDNLTFFRLDNDGSPFVADGTAAHSQYWLLVKDSPAAGRYTGN